MRYRKLRIAWSVAWGIAAVLLCEIWFRTVRFQNSGGIRAMLYRLKAKFDIAELAEEEVRATGWDRSDHAPGR